MKTLTGTGKILLTLLLAFALVFSSVSCNGSDSTNGKTDTSNNSVSDTGHLDAFDYSAIPLYSGNEYVTVNNNTPFFTDEEKVTEAYETYAPLDSLGRCTFAIASLHKSLMPTEDRESISSVKPSGWIQASYDFISGKYLYNRSHLIGFQLSGENALDTNLITGTRYLNEAMIPFENMVAAYLKETDNHVMYRVSPIFLDENLVASGVLVEAFSVEDAGEGICFNLFFYNVQPGVYINYKTGASYESGIEDIGGSDNTGDDQNAMYTVNKSNGKIHKSDCSNAIKMSEANKLMTDKSLEELIKEGYVKAGCCLGG